jgi:hypothetical protein
VANLTRGEVNALRDATWQLNRANDALSAAVKKLEGAMGRRNAATLRAVATRVALLETVAELDRQLGSLGEGTCRGADQG